MGDGHDKPGKNLEIGLETLSAIRCLDRGQTGRVYRWEAKAVADEIESLRDRVAEVIETHRIFVKSAGERHCGWKPGDGICRLMEINLDPCEFCVEHMGRCEADSKAKALAEAAKRALIALDGRKVAYEDYVSLRDALRDFEAHNEGEG